MTRRDQILIVVAVLIAAALFVGGCKYNQWKMKKQTGTVVTVIKDSLIYRDTGRVVPYMVEKIVKGKDGKIIYDTLWGGPEIIIEPADTAAILARFYETAHYTHTVDTGRWKITVNESVTQNRIKDWSLKAVSSDTVTTNTVVLKPPKNFVVYYTLSTGGNFNNPLYQQGAGIAIKMPSDKVYQVEIKRVGNHRPMVEARMMWPIRFGKR